MTLPEAIADPRAQQPNAATVNAEPAFIDKYGPLVTPYGHQLKPSGDRFTSAAEIGAATAVEFGKGGLLTAVVGADPARRRLGPGGAARGLGDAGGAPRRRGPARRAGRPPRRSRCSSARPGRGPVVGGQEDPLVAAVGAGGHHAVEHQQVAAVAHASTVTEVTDGSSADTPRHYDEVRRSACQPAAPTPSSARPSCTPSPPGCSPRSRTSAGGPRGRRGRTSTPT